MEFVCLMGLGVRWGYSRYEFDEYGTRTVEIRYAQGNHEQRCDMTISSQVLMMKRSQAKSALFVLLGTVLCCR